MITLSTDYRPRIFIGSSGEAKYVAQAIQSVLEDSFEVQTWWQGAFNETPDMLSSLADIVTGYDFGIFVLTPDGDAEIRNQKVKLGNVNVVLEFAMFLGHLGVEHVFLVTPRDAALQIPSDLQGLIIKRHQVPAEEKAIRSKVETLCGEIRDSIWKRSEKWNPSDARLIAGSHERRHRAAVLSSFKTSPHLVVEDCQLSFAIQEQGDVVLTDTFDGVSVLGGLVSSLSSEVHARTGRPSKPMVALTSASDANQKIDWKWLNEGGPGPAFPGSITFSPPLKGTAKISFTRSQTVANAFAWTSDDALISSKYKRDYERLYHTVSFAAKRMEIAATFPPDHFPEQFSIHAFVEIAGGSEMEDFTETQRVRPFFRQSEIKRKVTLEIVKPLAGYRYEVRWQLPKSEEYFAPSNDPARRYAFEVLDRVLAVDFVPAPTRAELKDLLITLRHDLGKLYKEDAARLDATDCQLFVIDSGTSSLRCVATLNRRSEDALRQFQFKPGQGLAGRTFRLREFQFYKNVEGQEPVGLSTPVPVTGPLKGTMLGIPLMLHDSPGHAFGCIALHQPKGSSRLEELFQDADLQAAMAAATATWFSGLLKKFGTKSSSGFWRTQKTHGAGAR